MNRLLAVAVVPVLLATLAGLVLLWPQSGSRSRSVPPEQLIELAKLVNGVVISDRPISCADQPEAGGGCHVATVRLDSGPDRGVITELQLFDGVGQPRVVVGDKLIVGRTSDDTGVSYYFSDFQRRVPLGVLALLFVVVVAGIGRLRGLTSIFGVWVTFGILVWFV
ncbi:MAG: hypothetical protein ACRDRT_08460, partial [Pseudonocardiaceae bacterium]